MELGWAESAPRLRSRLPNLNLLPAELLPTPLPWLTAGLVLLSLGLLMLLYALFYMKSYADLETAALRDRLADGQTALRAYGLPVDAVGPDGQLLLPPGTVEDWAELRARQVDWSAVFGVVASSVTPAIQISGLSQAGYTVSIAGDAASAQDANTFLQKLRDSGLFISLEMNIAAQQPEASPVATPAPPPPAPTAIPAPTQPPAPPPTSPPAPPPTPPPAVAKPGGNSGGPPVPPPAAPPPPAVAPPAPTNTLAPRTPLATPSPIGTPPTVGPTATPTPQYDFIVQSKRETVDPAAIGNNSAIRVRVIDGSGQLVPGLRVHIDSQGDPPWSSELPRPGDNPSNGTFEFPVGMGKFTVWVMNGSSERATDLFTGVQGQPGVHVWDVTFRKTIGGTPAAEPVCTGCTPTPIPSPTNTVAPTPTPVSVGSNLANLACVTASDKVLPDHGPEKAVDGDVNSYWDSGHGPVQQITLDFTRYPNNYANTNLACKAKPSTVVGALDPSSTTVDQNRFNAVTVEAIELVPLMTGASKVTHEVWTIYDSDTIQLEYTFADVDANDNVTMSTRFAAVRTVKQLRIRTIRSAVNVEWREVRLFQPLPPAFGSWTATPTSTPTFGGVPTGTPTPLAQATIAIGSLQASSENPGNPAAFAADGNSLTFWRPVTNQSPAFLQANFASAQTVQGVRFLTAMGDAIATQTATVGPSTPTPTPFGATYRVVLLRPSLAAAGLSGTPTPTATAPPPRTVGSVVRSALGLETPTPAARAGPGRAAQDVDCNFQFVAQDNATVQLICSETSGVTGVRIYIDSPGNPALPPGIRELTIYPPVATATATSTPTATTVASSNATPTVTATRTGTVAAAAAATSSATATSTRTATVTPTGGVVASSGGPLAALMSMLEPSRAWAAPFDQAPPKPTPSQATLPPAVQTTIAQAQRPPAPPPAPTRPAVVGAPQAVATAVPGAAGPPSPAAGPAGQPPVAGPSAAPPVVNSVPPPIVSPNRPAVNAPAPAGAGQPFAVAPAATGAAAPPAGAQPAAAVQVGSRGRVSFVIVAQVRPGAP